MEYLLLIINVKCTKNDPNQTFKKPDNYELHNSIFQSGCSNQNWR